MDDELDPALNFAVLAANMQLDRRETRTLVESLATMLQEALPDQVTITRGGWMLSKDKPIEDLLVRFDDVHYQISKQKNSKNYSAKALKIVRGIALKSTELEIAECISKIVEHLTAMSEKNSSMRSALRNFITG